jgi:hypothetical protein
LTQEVKTQWRTRIAHEKLERYKEDVAAFIERYGMAVFQAQKATCFKSPKNRCTKQLKTSNEP